MWVAWRLILARNNMGGRLVTNSLILQLNSALKYGSENKLERALTDRIVDQLWSELPSFTVQSVFFSASLFTIQEKIWRALPVHKNLSLKAKQCTKICFWKHFRRQIGDAVTKIWLRFDQRCLLNFLTERERERGQLSLSLSPSNVYTLCSEYKSATFHDKHFSENGRSSSSQVWGPDPNPSPLMLPYSYLPEWHSWPPHTTGYIWQEFVVPKMLGIHGKYEILTLNVQYLILK